MTLTRRFKAAVKGTSEGRGTAWTDKELEALERRHDKGMSVQQVVEEFTNRGERLTEATFRKYVQLGLLPRSVRVGRKGKNRGSQGLYPATVVRQINHIRRLMGQGFTIEEIQRELLFVRGDIDALGRQLARVYAAIAAAIEERSGETGSDPHIARALEEARALGSDLLSKLESIERRLSMHARMARAVV